MRNYKKISIFILLTLILNLLPFYTVSAYSAEFNITEKNIVITENGSYRVIGDNSTTNTIYIADNLDDVTIDVDNISVRHSSSFGTAPIEVGKNTHVTLNFIGDNVLLGYSTPAIAVESSDSSVTISGSGNVTATGGEYSAAIGSSKDNTAGSIIINSASVTANGGNRAAAIGTGSAADGSKITINGGSVKAKAFGGGAAIGAGYNGDFGMLTVNGGDITAIASDGGAAIGGGYRGIGGEITINGGSIYANSSDGGYGIGSGRYAVGSVVTISKDATVSAFSANDSEAVESAKLTTDAIAFAGGFSGSFFRADTEFTFTSDTSSQNITFPKGAKEMYVTINSAGLYTITADDTKLAYKKSSAKIEKFDIKNEYIYYEFTSVCDCELSPPSFVVDNVVLSKGSKTKSVTLKADDAEFTRSDDCSTHESKSPTIKYKYEIVEDKAAIAQITNKTLKVTVDNPGTYTVVVRATAYVGDGEISASAETPVKVTKQTEALDIEDGDIYIRANGIYNIEGDSKHNAIFVSDDLLDVTLVFSNVDIDLSSNSGKNKTPITIGAGSNVTVTANSACTFTAKKDYNAITLNYSDMYTAPTTLNFNGASKITFTSSGKESCISGKESEIYFFDGDIYLYSEDAPAVESEKVFVSEKSKIFASCESNKKLPFTGTFINKKVNGYNPAYFLQIKLKNTLDLSENSKTFIVVKNSDTGKSTSISSITEDILSVAFILPYDEDETDGYYYATYRSTNANTTKYLTYTENDETYREFYSDSPNTVVQLETSKCKCKLSAPKFKLTSVTLAADETTKKFSLNAEDAVLKVDDDCIQHKKSNSINYKYVVIEDEDDVASIQDSRLVIEAYDAGKHKVKVQAIAEVNGLTATKDASLTVTKLTEEATEKMRGEEHKPYISGYDDGEFKPDNNITRAEAARIIINAFDYRYTSNDSEFADVSIKDWFYDDVATMESMGVMTGYEDGTFAPNQTMTRAEFSVVMCRVLNIQKNSGKSKLSDVSDHWASQYINALVKKKIISGYENGTFRPDNPITRAEVVTLVNKALNRSPNAELASTAGVDNDFTDLRKKHWAYYEIMEASNKHYCNDWH